MALLPCAQPRSAEEARRAPNTSTRSTRSARRTRNANKRILKNVEAKAQSNAGKLTQAGTQFTSASAAFGKSMKKIDAVPRPAAEDAAAAQVVRLPRTSSRRTSRKLGKALKEDDKIKAAHEKIRAERSQQRRQQRQLRLRLPVLPPDARSFSWSARRHAAQSSLPPPVLVVSAAAAPPESTRRTRPGARMRATAASA